MSGDRRAADDPGVGQGSPSSLSVQVERTPLGIILSLRGRCDERDLELVERLLEDLVGGQGNRSVTVAAGELDGGAASTNGVLGRVEALARERGVHFALDCEPLGGG